MFVQQPEWTRQAACAGLSSRDSDPWHPAVKGPRVWDEARAVCMACPVQVQCVRYGLELLNQGTVEGMYGGMTPVDLRSLARRIQRSSRKVAAHGTRVGYVNLACRCQACRAANARYEASRRLAAPGPSDRCLAADGSGARCRRRAVQGSVFCGTHADLRVSAWMSGAAARGNVTGPL